MIPIPFSKRRAKHLRLGRRGERLAVCLLRELGLNVLCRNYRAMRGEIDIVARDYDTLCFVEVKTRRRIVHSRPADAVGRSKQRHIIRAAKQYLKELGHPNVAHRYDIVEAVLDGLNIRDIRYWRNAFTEETAKSPFVFIGERANL
ncbi:MAG: YraN family protein [Candidatus Pacebacteria bacterium]|nr:YraN family protein [Candidatus Paceibacterota bacterium]